MNSMFCVRIAHSGATLLLLLSWRLNLKAQPLMSFVLKAGALDFPKYSLRVIIWSKAGDWQSRNTVVGVWPPLLSAPSSPSSVALISRHINPLVDSAPVPAWAQLLCDQRHWCSWNCVHTCNGNSCDLSLVGWCPPPPRPSPGCRAADQGRQADCVNGWLESPRGGMGLVHPLLV